MKKHCKICGRLIPSLSSFFAEGHVRSTFLMPKWKKSGDYCSWGCWRSTRTIEVTCPVCGKVVTYKKGARRKTCSKECGRKLRQKPKTQTCLDCGTPMWRPGHLRCRECGPKHEKDRIKNGKKLNCECKICGKKFHASKSRIEKGNAKYCSSECYSKSRRTRPKQKCEHCGKVFVRHYEGRKYCSLACWRSAKIETRQCRACGKSFVCLKSAKKRSCSKQCGAQHRVTRIQKVCISCNAPFITTPSVTTKRCKKCRLNYFRKNKKDNFKCIVCNKALYQSPSRLKVAVVCSIACATKYKTTSVETTMTCALCEKPFTVRIGRVHNSNRQFCSDACCRKSKRLGATIESGKPPRQHRCLNCGRFLGVKLCMRTHPFNGTKRLRKIRNTKFCNRKCAFAYERLKPVGAFTVNSFMKEIANV